MRRGRWKKIILVTGICFLLAGNTGYSLWRSSGAADNVWYHIQYDKEVESQTVEAYSETAYTEGEGARIHYYIEGEMVSEGTFYKYIGEKYGSENIRGENAKILWSEEKIEDRK